MKQTRGRGGKERNEMRLLSGGPLLDDVCRPQIPISFRDLHPKPLPKFPLPSASQVAPLPAVAANREKPATPMLSFQKCELPISNALAAENIFPRIARRISAPKTAACFMCATIWPA